MSWKSPSYHLRVFGMCLGLVLVALLGVLFGVRMEAITHASGVVQARDIHEVRAPLPGLVELGWHEGEILHSDSTLRVRLDRQGNGASDPGQGEVRKLENFRCKDGKALTLDQFRFHKLQTGDLLWPDQVVAFVRVDDWTAAQTLGPPPARTQAALLSPVDGQAWKVLKVAVSSGQAVRAGDLLCLLAPANADTGEPRGWIAQLDIPEKHAAGAAPGQEVRLYSAMFNQRLHGHAEGTVEKIEAVAEPSASGSERVFKAQVKITHSPFPLHHGTSMKAEIVLGRKRVYRIILEQ